MAAFVQRDVQRSRDGQIVILRDCIAEEIPVALIYNGTAHVVMMATPQNLDDFALGFSLSEGLIETAAELQSIDMEYASDAVRVLMQIPERRHAALLLQGRNLIGRSGCGICGTQDIAQVLRAPEKVGEGVFIFEAALKRALAHLHDQQSINAVTGATHAAAWATSDGVITMLREDVGRHNALDKLIGALIRIESDFDAGFLLVTSRASYEMALKAVNVGISLMAAISAPTALAIRVAEQANMSLIGFARPQSHVIYTHPKRIVSDPAARST
ncbi:formate dehydrogenase accessory sulfurtransferase FdhD [Pseudolysobacter antarcticus]|uniref:Sulfur carrier protein FdhD n=2 Tax=Pseudolysobacter antarcticus TaxID=2511995 RepID=A0A411HQA9_9GAMM|nr:formate dehydrogenase accessory sulfurtransferase FdhD [Pseudolysobacter antarcticus]